MDYHPYYNCQGQWTCHLTDYRYCVQ